MKEDSPLFKRLLHNGLKFFFTINNYKALLTCVCLKCGCKVIILNINMLSFWIKGRQNLVYSKSIPKPFQPFKSIFRYCCFHRTKAFKRLDCFNHWKLFFWKTYLFKYIIRYSCKQRRFINCALFFNNFLNIKYLHTTSKLIYGTLFSFSPCISFIMMIYPKQNIDITFRLAHNDSPISIINSYRANILVYSFIYLFKIDSRVCRIISELVKKLSYLALFLPWQCCICSQKIS